MGSCQSRLLLPALALVSALAGEPAQCPAGSFCPPKSAAPILSPGGQFCPFGSSQPTDCPEKQHCPSNSSRPQQCPAGSFCPSASAAPVICPLGHFCPNGSSEPKKCPAGYRCESHLDIRTLLAPEGLVQWNQLMSSAKKFALVGGIGHSMLMVDHHIWTWGGNGHGQLGIGSAENAELPMKLPITEEIAAIAAGGYHSLALTASGELCTWGGNNYGQLGIGSREDRLTPTRVSTKEKFVAIAAGGYHSLALTASGEVYTWGRNHVGQLGIGNTNNDQLIPTKVRSDKRFVAIAAGGWHSMALTAFGELWTWGGNDYGQLGIGNTQNQLTPIQVSDGNTFVAIGAGWDRSVALTSSGGLWTWGRNDYGQLGIGSSTDQHQPTQVSSDEAFVAIAPGKWHCMALTVSGEWWAWGRNDWGQLGIGHTNYAQTRPTKVLAQGHQSFVAAAAGGFHSLAVTHSGELYTWGWNYNGQLGSGNRKSKASPTKVSNAFFQDKNDDAPKQFLVSKWRSCDEMLRGEDLATTMKNAWCEVSPGSAVQCGSVYLRARHCSPQETFVVLLGASEALPCEAGTYCREGKGFALTCPEGHFCNRRASHPEPCASGWICPAGTSNETTPGVQHAAAAEVVSGAGWMEEQRGTMPPCAAFAAELEVANAANAELKQKAASATTETEAAQKSNAELEKKAASAAAEMEAAKKSIAELEKKAASATAETEAAQKSNAKLEKKAASAAAEMEAAKKSIAKLEKKAASATAEMEAAKKSIAEFEKKATSATAEMEAAQKSIAELKKKAASATAEVEMPSLTWTEILVLPMSLAVMMAGTLVVRTGSALWGGKGFPVTHTIQDGKRVVAVECAGVSIHNVRIEYDGRSKGTIQIDRTEAFGLPAISCKQDFQLEDEGSWFEWLQSETRCEDGLLVIPFQPVAPQRQVLRVPQVFHMGDDPCDDAPETTDAKASKSEVVSVSSFDLSSASKTGSSWQRC